MFIKNVTASMSKCDDAEAAILKSAPLPFIESPVVAPESTEGASKSPPADVESIVMGSAMLAWSTGV